VTKPQILNLIRETAAANGGEPLGINRFSKQTGLSIHSWRGKFWLRWSEALAEAGFAPNPRDEAYSPDFLLEKLALLAREHGHFPTYAETRLAKHRDATFPGHGTFNRLGSKSERVRLLRDFVRSKPAYADVLALPPAEDSAEEPESSDAIS
jgi:hypothetical protein